ncbi:hypothetical protein BGW36DRAFT_436248 [Talaromyces proteolyticus]|uniref:Zn(2)-C6 fungal-type domain-containing protein n=1 Tax=Talaromyces proteolyticus TaxID=1131652 RepID=A0AAD4Q1V4_9EURO|nr:uncharacterized protein BGW36DRAFT_436248 [Talaromyces proteolyticus]KAH8706045.1 hypothetical protein BGW36DRAFT_436248 [Talaromyces proteolyticus]
MVQHRTRARVACFSCHQRKIRCDLAIHGCPCTNCRLDKNDGCAPAELVCRKPTRFAKPEISDNDKTQDHNVYRIASFNNKVISQITFDEFMASVPENQAHIVSRQDSFAAQRSLEIEEIMATASPLGNVFFSFHQFLDTSFLSTLPADDIRFLASKGCMHVPDHNIILQFLQQYFLNVQPCLPVLDEADFWHMYYGHNDGTSRGRKMSLFVFQALLFASCSFVSQDIVRKCGFHDKRSARSSFYNRAKLMFNLKAEDRSWARAQGALLLAYQTSSDGPQSASVWLSCAIETTMIIDAHVAQSSSRQDDKISLKRLCWSILLRDRIICLGLRRGSQITSNHLNMWQNRLDERDFAPEIIHSMVYNQATKCVLFDIFQTQCELAITLTDLVSIVYSHGLSRSSVSPEESEELIIKIQKIKSSLSQWKEVANIKLHSISSSSIATKPVTMFKNMTFLLYHTARVALSHYEAFMVEGHFKYFQTRHSNQLQAIGNELRDATAAATRIIKDFSATGQIETLPLSLVAYAAFPMILSAVDLKLSSSFPQLTSRQQQLNCFAKVVRQSQSLYDVMDEAAILFNRILHLAYSMIKGLFLQQDHSSAAGLKSRTSSWHDAFLRCPRFHLRLSAAMDYSLSYGHYPRNDALPRLVRPVPSILMESQSSWMVNHPKTLGCDEQAEDDLQNCSPHEGYLFDDSTPILLYEDWSNHIHMTEEMTQQKKHETETDAELKGEGSVLEHVKYHINMGNDRTIRNYDQKSQSSEYSEVSMNLNFLDLDALKARSR